MLIVILLYDQLLFRPLVAWSGKFRFETTAATATPDPWMLKLIRQTRLFQAIFDTAGGAIGKIFRLRLGAGASVQVDESAKPSRVIDVIWYAIIAAVAGYAFWRIVAFISVRCIGAILARRC